VTDRPTPTNAQTPDSKRKSNAAIIRDHKKRKTAQDESFSPLLELVKARLREFYREPAIVFWVFVFPLLMALGLGAAFRSQPQPIPAIAVVSETSGEAEKKLVNALTESEQVDASILSRSEARQELARAKIDLMVTVDASGATFRFDPKKETGPIAKLITNRVIQESAGRSDPVATSETAVTELGSRYIDFLIPGLIGMNLMGSSMWGVGFNFVVARKRKLLRRYAVTPMRRTHFLLSYMLSRALFLVMELGLLVSFGLLLFGTKIQGNPLTFLAFSVLGAASFAGISLIIGARLENTETANGWMNFVQMPMFVLSGAFFSYERFPDWLHLPIELLPLTALINALRTIYNEAAGIGSLGFEFAVLAAWGLAGFFVALRTFRWQ